MALDDDEEPMDEQSTLVRVNKLQHQCCRWFSTNQNRNQNCQKLAVSVAQKPEQVEPLIFIIFIFLYLGTQKRKNLCILSLSVFGVGWGLSISQETIYFPALCGQVVDPFGMPRVRPVTRIVSVQV